MSEEERKASTGLLGNWAPGEYEKALESAGEAAEALFLEATKQIIDDQVGAGVDVPTDGEVRRENYIFYQCRRLGGVSFDTVTHKSVRQGAFEADLPTIVGPVSLTETRLADDWKAAQQFTEKPVKITIPGPLTIADSIANDYYDDPKKMGADLADALNVEVMALADAGCTYIQVDEPVFARKPVEALDYGFDHLERSFHGLPGGVKRVVHMCCGYPNALDSETFMKADARCYFDIAKAIDESSIDEVSIEDAHRHNDLALLENFQKTSVILGVIAIAKSRIESVDEVRDRLAAALEHIDADRLIAAPDCGLGFMTREMAVAKLRVLSEAAKSI
ncbi:MAG: cobalamin-independent methionine synthase II family protein [Alphaproteobacteria bacterium]|nr:cobalamin-independent methionine synthase II family protein [Alphaproteobacteria bacterium]